MTRHEFEQTIMSLDLEAATLRRDEAHARLLAARSTQQREEMMTESVRKCLAEAADLEKLPKFS